MLGCTAALALVSANLLRASPLFVLHRYAVAVARRPSHCSWAETRVGEESGFFTAKFRPPPPSICSTKVTVLMSNKLRSKNLGHGRHCNTSQAKGHSKTALANPALPLHDTNIQRLVPDLWVTGGFMNHKLWLESLLSWRDFAFSVRREST